MGDYDKAIADCTEAIRLTPNSALAYTNRSVARMKQSDFSGAILGLYGGHSVRPGGRHRV